METFYYVTKELQFFATTSNNQMPISLHPDSVHLWHFKLRLFDTTDHSYFEISKVGLHRYRALKLELVAKTEFLSGGIPSQKSFTQTTSEATFVIINLKKWKWHGKYPVLKT